MTTLLLGIAAAWPCGGLTHGEGTLAESAGIEVLFEPGEDTVTVSYAVAYTGDATAIGWVIPVPGEVLSVADGDPERFWELRAASEPLVDYPDEAGGGGGCGCLGGGSKGDRSLAGSDRGSVQSNALEVLGSGFTGEYAYVLIGATDAAELEVWFEENGWTGLATEDLDHYVAAGAMFVAISVLPEGPSEVSAPRLLPPVEIAYGGTEMSFPVVMARHGAREHRSTLYVLADSRAEIGGDWTQQDGSLLYGGPQADPSALWLERLDIVGRDRAYVRTFAGDLDDAFLTRFDVRVSRDLLDSDPVIALDGSTAGVQTRIVLGEDVPPSQAAIPFSVLWLAWLGRRRRSGCPRSSLFVASRSRCTAGASDAPSRIPSESPPCTQVRGPSPDFGTSSANLGDLCGS